LSVLPINVSEVKTVYDEVEANRFLANGWELLSVFPILRPMCVVKNDLIQCFTLGLPRRD